MKKKFTIGGAIIGLASGVGMMGYVFIKGPGSPGFHELLFQLAIVGVLTVVCALQGLFIGWIISFVWPTNKPKSPNQPPEPTPTTVTGAVGKL
jgi:hypothetical protein